MSDLRWGRATCVAMLFLSLLIGPLWAMDGEVLRETAEATGPTETTPLMQAHAHNDYNHEVPLFDALGNGFCSVEADVFLIDGKLLVGHSHDELKAERTLESLYLNPLLDRVRQNGGHVFPDGPTFTLLVDVKSDGEETYIVLDTVLGMYEDMLTSVTVGKVERKPVTVIISGNRAWERIASDPTRYAGVDGRLTDLGSDRSTHLMPLISDHWGQAFKWDGRGPMPDSERAELRRIVQDAHNHGQRVRFWATPDQPSPERTAVWSELLAADVDLIGTDDLGGLRKFLLSQMEVTP